ncbi:sigma-70 family RNA polymerase sigma factor [Enterococcus raffinosus]|uniref:sigma-70 family RNA polymerase sigma factor n=1 Tax=Enterococcus raffinosus TaxID=71452 RepID=UPI00288CAE04|nr:sigma-70 family RNA polymerase sigma factor [Enterococcus raffinosus]MDT2556640.1 sigma-70 family RNA polymerase sigma factor [Enterococcus raffinosus]
MTEMDVTFIFIRYISVTIKRQSKTFYNRFNKIYYYENKEFVENIEIEKRPIEFYSSSSSYCFDNLEEKIFYRELLHEGLNSLTDMEKQLICEKFINQRSDADIGKELSVSSQMASKRKRIILGKLKSFFNI